mmetsp:Transcript_62330/g.157754  ORF Transcript_62330/g.157754 Transcript_62330/m.157754 type:complete len:221 (-) Transcript_62330:242-904(-)
MASPRRISLFSMSQCQACHSGVGFSLVKKLCFNASAGVERCAGSSASRPPRRSKQLSVRQYFEFAGLPAPCMKYFRMKTFSSPTSCCSLALTIRCELKVLKSGNFETPGQVSSVGFPRVWKISSTYPSGVLCGRSGSPAKRGSLLPDLYSKTSANMQPTDQTSNAGPYLRSPRRSSIARYGRETIMFGSSRFEADRYPKLSSSPNATREMPKSQTLISPD